MTSRRRSNGSEGEPSSRIQVPENVSEFYANSFNVAVTPWDFILFFGTNTLPTTVLKSGPAQSTVSVRVDVVVRMSPQHTKATLAALKRTVDEYEKRFGEINIPSDQPGGGDENS